VDLPPGDELVTLWDRKHQEAGSFLWSRSEVSGLRKDRNLTTVKVLGRTFTDLCAICGRADRVPQGTLHGLLLAVAAAVLDQACASTSVLVYAQTIIKNVGVHNAVLQDQFSLVVVIAKAVGVIIGLIIVDRMGRRPLLTWGGVFSAAFMTLLTVGSAMRSVPLLLAGMGGFITAFISTWGVGYWAVVVEVTAVGGPRYSSAAQSLATATLFAAGWLTGLTFDTITSGNPYGLLVYVVVCVLMTIYAACLLPEMGGRSLEGCGHTMGREDEAEEASDEDGDLASESASTESSG